MTPQQSEALGFLSLNYGGFIVQTPLPDEWPLDLIRRGNIVEATEEILRERFNDFLDRFPLLEDLIGFTRRLAETAGIPGEGAFGGIPKLLAQLEFYADDIELQLAERHVSLVDYYRGELTLRQVFVYLKHPWNRTHYLLADVFHGITRQPHPDRPLSDREQAQAEAERAEKRRREALMREKEKQYANPVAVAAEQAEANALRELSRKGL